jgi:uncharacterized protein YcbK (DUF882 family)
MNLSKNFTLSELVKSDAGLRLNLDNTPSRGIINNLHELVTNVLQPIRDHYDKPIRINSGYRSSVINAVIGGSKTSDHVQGFAADIEIAGVTNYDLANWIKDNLKFTQVILEFYTMGVPDSGWVHVSYDPKNLKNQCLTAIKKEGKTIYLTGLVA